MPADLTIFAATYLVFIATVLAGAVVAVRLWSRPRLAWLQWGLAAALTLMLSYALGRLGGALYTDPRPFTTNHVPPLIAHAPDNGFPSDHALLAAALVALVALVDRGWALVLGILAVLVAWARVGAGLHHVVDVVGSAVFVAMAALVALSIVTVVMRWMTPHLPPGWKAQRLLEVGRC